MKWGHAEQDHSQPQWSWSANNIYPSNSRDILIPDEISFTQVFWKAHTLIQIVRYYYLQHIIHNRNESSVTAKKYLLQWLELKPQYCWRVNKFFKLYFFLQFFNFISMCLRFMQFTILLGAVMCTYYSLFLANNFLSCKYMLNCPYFMIIFKIVLVTLLLEKLPWAFLPYFLLKICVWPQTS